MFGGILGCVLIPTILLCAVILICKFIGYSPIPENLRRRPRKKVQMFEILEDAVTKYAKEKDDN